MTPAVNVIILFSFVTDKEAKKARVFVHGNQLNPNIFEQT
jgi:hypothetical protein